MISLILSGGVGSRLWPVSRKKFPKQFIDIFEQSLFEKTVRRLSQFGKVHVCTGESMKTLTDSTIREKKLAVEEVFYEPMGRNTAPAIALVCKYMQDQQQTDQVMGVFPSDHWIEDENLFGNVIQLAEKVALTGKIVTLGIKPNYPATGFGYIECLSEQVDTANDLTAFKVKGFREKPDEKTAEEFIKSGQFFWNSGMFIFQVSTMISAFEKHMPELWQGIQELKNDLSNIAEVYPKLPSQSIDYGIMEKFQEQANIPSDFGWSDLGSWDDIASMADKETTMNNKSVQVDVNAENCFSFTGVDKAVAFANVSDLLVVDTPDALLITKKGESQSVKDVFDKLSNQAPELTVDHVFEKRPWGEYRNLWEEDHFKSKVITVNPNQQLSYQSHTKRAETWVIVSGQGEVVLDDKIIPVSQGSVVQIPVGAKHRMRNTSDSILEFVEVQLGEYFGEDDITRYEDDYKRV